MLAKAPTAASVASHGAAVVVTTEAEKHAWAPLSKLEGVRVVCAEHLLTCVLRQQLLIEEPL